jgi:hypothetical protein
MNPKQLSRLDILCMSIMLPVPIVLFFSIVYLTSLAVIHIK